MAKLTDTIASVDSGRRPLEAPEPAGQSFLGGLADIGKNLVKVGEALYQDADRNAANAAARRAFELRAHPPREDVGVPSDQANVVDPEMPGVPGAIAQTANRLGSLRLGAEQGRVSATRLQIETEAAYAELMQQFPGHELAISETFRVAGIQSYLTQEIDAAVDQANFEREQAQITRATRIKAAVDHGYVGTNDELEAKGIEVIKAIDEHEAQLEALRLDRERNPAPNSADDKARRERLEADVAQGYIARGSSLLGPVIDRLTTYVTVAGVGDEQALQQINTNFTAAVAAYKTNAAQRMRAQHIPESQIIIFEQRMDAMQQTMERLMTGPSSRAAAAARSLQFMNNRLGLDSFRSVELYRQATALFGAARVETVFSDDPISGLTPELAARLRDERTAAARGLGTPEGLKALMTVGEIVAGNTSLQALPGPVAIQTAPSLYRVMQGDIRRLNDGTAEPDEVPGYLNSAGDLADAAISLPPGGQTSMLAFQTVANGLGSNANIRALAAAAKVDPQGARRVVGVTRLAMVNAMNVGRGVRVNDFGGSLQVFYNERTGRWDAKVDQEAYNRFLQSNGMSSGLTRPGTFDPATGRTARIPLLTPEQFRAREMARRGAGGIRDKVDSLNEALDFLAATTSHEEELARLHLTEKEYRTFYATGRRPRAAAGNTSDPASVSKGLQDLVSETALLPAQIATNVETSLQGSDQLLQESGPGFEAAAAAWRANENNDNGITDINGATVRFGINAAFHPEVNQPGFTWEKAQEILKRDYWDALGADSLDPGLARLAFDQGGVIGVPTMKGLLAQAGGDVGALANLIENHYRAIVKRDPSKANQLQGWLTRLRRTTATAERLAGGH